MMAVRRWEVTSGRFRLSLTSEVCSLRAFGSGMCGGSTGEADPGRLVRVFDRCERMEAGSCAVLWMFCPESMRNTNGGPETRRLHITVPIGVGSQLL